MFGTKGNEEKYSIGDVVFVLPIVKDGWLIKKYNLTMVYLYTEYPCCPTTPSERVTTNLYITHIM